MRALIECYGPPEHIDGLRISWAEQTQQGELGLVFVNPPFGHGQLKRWTEKCREEGIAGAEVILLCPANTAAIWMHDNVLPWAQAIHLWRGRIEFGNAPPGTKSDNPPMGNTAFAYWGGRRDLFLETFAQSGFGIDLDELDSAEFRRAVG